MKAIPVRVPARHPVKVVMIAPCICGCGAWAVETIDDDGAIETAKFMGRDALGRADRYAATEYPDVVPLPWVGDGVGSGEGK
jgi:hypothetical protein